MIGKDSRRNIIDNRNQHGVYTYNGLGKAMQQSNNPI